MFDKLFLWRQHIFFKEALVNNIPCWEVSGHHKGGPITCRCLPHSHLLCVLPHHGREVSCRGAGGGGGGREGEQVSYQSLRKDVSNDSWAPIPSCQARGSLSLQIAIRWRRHKTHQLPDFFIASGPLDQPHRPYSPHHFPMPKGFMGLPDIMTKPSDPNNKNATLLGTCLQPSPQTALLKVTNDLHVPSQSSLRPHPPWHLRNI